MRFELRHPEVELPGGDDPLVVVAPSTVHDSARALVGAAIAALASEPVRVAATLNQRGAQWTEPAPPNVVVTDWLSYAHVMPKASLVISNGGHGTVVRALAEGVPVLVCPVGADTAENGARDLARHRAHDPRAAARADGTSRRSQAAAGRAAVRRPRA